MASSRRSRPADGAARVGAAVVDAVRAALSRLPSRANGPRRVAIALSGGRDSMVLLDAVARIAPALALDVSAIHVHHGLSPNADRWSAFCTEQCASRGVALEVCRVDVARDDGDGIEAAARRARYEALADTDADALLLAHHADDQAETVLLQLLRGAGPHGLAAMPAVRIAARVQLLRPLLAMPRRALAQYAAAHALAWIDDESNADPARVRNFIRHHIAPRLADAFAGYPQTLARAATHQAEAALLADELAILDASGALENGTLDRERLAAFASSAPHRARNVLRWFLRAHGLRAPSTARLAAMLEQIVHAGRDARVQLRHDGMEIGLHRGRIVVHCFAAAPFAVAWRGETQLSLPHGTLEFAPASGEGIAVALAQSRAVVVRSREGGERMRLAARGAQQSVKHLLQRAGVPHWARGGVPLVFCGDALAAVPGIGVDAAFVAAPGAPGYTLRWKPRVQGGSFEH